MAILNKDQILKIDDLPKIEVEVPEWGGTVLITMMSGEARMQYENFFVSQGDSMQATENLTAKLIALTLVDENGKRIFSDEDIPLINKKSAKALATIFRMSLKHNKLDRESAEETKKN